MAENYVFFIFKKVIAKKKILQVTNKCYDAQSIFIFYPQTVRSI